VNAKTRHAAGAAAALVLILTAPACRAPDPKALLDVSDVDAFWAVEPSMGGEQYIAPAVKIRIHNRSETAQHSVQAMAVFRRKGEENLTWGSAFEQVVSRKNPLAPGQSIGVTLKSDARYHSQGPVDGMFTHAQFKDALVEIFLRVGSSGWVGFGQLPVERRVGSRSVASPPPASSPPGALPTGAAASAPPSPPPAR
jgi:hypothetical protein